MKCIDKTTSIEFCPSCGTSRTVSVTIIPLTVTDGKGSIETIVIKTYHCEFCHSFVRSTERTGDSLTPDPNPSTVNREPVNREP